MSMIGNGMISVQGMPTANRQLWLKADDESSLLADAGSSTTDPDACQFTAVNDEYLSVASNASLATGDIDFTVAAWVYLDSKGQDRDIITKWGASGTWEYALYFRNAIDTFRFICSANGTAISITIDASSTYGSPPLSKWHYVIGWHDATANKIYIQVNDTAAAVSGNFTSGLTPLGADVRIGWREEAGAEEMNGRIMNVAFWKRVLTATERTYLFNTGLGHTYDQIGVANTDGSDLKTGLISWWKLNEPSGDRIDPHGGNDLTDNNTVTGAAGITQPVASFTRANSEELSIADNASLSMGGAQDFTISGWFRQTTDIDNLDLISKWNASSANREYILLYNSSSNVLEFYVSQDGTSSTVINASALGDPVLNQWYFFVAWHDAIADSVNIQIDNGTINSTSHTTGTFDSTAEFNIGGRDTGAQYYNGQLSNFALWKRTLTTAEKTWLYNAGNARTYAEIGVTGDDGSDLKTNLEAWWALSELSGTRYDSHGSNDLTDQNTVESLDGFKLQPPVTVYDEPDAADFVSANSEYLNIADNASLSMGDIDFTVAGWFYLKTDATMNLLGKGPSSGASKDFEYHLLYSTSANRFQFALGDSSTFHIESADNFGAATFPRWYFIVAWHDATANTVNIQVNDGTVDSGSYTAGSHDNTNDFAIGRAGEYTSNYANARALNVAIWKRTLTATERTWLFNTALGQTYEQIGVAGTDGSNLKTNLQAWWKLNESSGQRSDSEGSNNLTDNATVGMADGITMPVAHFTTGNSEYLSITDASQTGLDPGTGDFSVMFWVKRGAIANNHYVFSKGSTSEDNYVVWIDNQDDLEVRIEDEPTQVSLTVSDCIEDTLWHCLIINFDRSADVTAYSDDVDRGSTSITSVSGTIDNTDDFEIGRARNQANTETMQLANFGYWSRLLTAAERTWLFNYHQGRTYEEFGVTGNDGSNLLTNLVSYWPLSELSGTRYDAHGSNDLTDNNTVTVDIGVGYMTQPYGTAGGGGTGPVTDGSSVTSWDDVSGNGNDAEQLTLAKMPTWEDNEINSKPVVRCDNVDDFMDLADISLTGEFSIYAVYKTTDNAQGSATLIGEDSGTSGSTPKIGVASSNAFVRLVTTSDNTQALPTQGNPHIWFMSRDASDKVDLAFNGGSLNRLFTDAAQTGTYVIDTIFANQDESEHIDIDLAELIVYDTAHSVSKRRATERALSKKYNISLS